MEPVTLIDPLTKRATVVTTPTEEYNLRARGYYEPRRDPEPEPEPKPDLAETIKKAGQNGAKALKVLKDAAEAAKQENKDLGDAITTTDKSE